MKSHQLLIGIMCLSTVNRLSSAKETKISSIYRHTISSELDKAEDVDVLTACYTLANNGIAANIERSYLTIGKNIIAPHETTFREYPGGVPAPEAGCKHFEADHDTLSKYENGEAVFQLEFYGENMETLSSAYSKFTFPDFMDEGDVTETLVVGKDQDSLRIQFGDTVQDMTNWQVCNDKDDSDTSLQCDTIQSQICYAVAVGALANTNPSYSLCLKDETSGAVFKTAKITDQTPVAGTEFSSAAEVLLTYSPDGGSTPPTINVKGFTATTLEIVPYDPATKHAFGVCHALDTDCDLNDYPSSKKSMKLITTDINTATNTLDFEDYNVMGTNLGTKVIEMYWEKPTGQNYYAAFIAKGTSDTHLQEVITDCSGEDPPPGPTYCFAYFADTTPGDSGKNYFATIAPNQDDVGWDPLLNNQIKSAPIIPNPTKDSLGINIETTATIVTERNTEVDVCFKYVANASTQDTHYEFLAINSKGMWKKFLEEKKRDESYGCFYALELLTADLNEDGKFLVLLRNTRNRNVLASGEATFDVQAPRAIKPEVDNDSNGSTSTLAIVGAAIAGIACLMALVAAAVMFVMKMNRDNDGLQYPLHRYNIEDSSVIHGLDNPIPTM